MYVTYMLFLAVGSTYIRLKSKRLLGPIEYIAVIDYILRSIFTLLHIGKIIYKFTNSCVGHSNIYITVHSSVNYISQSLVETISRAAPSERFLVRGETPSFCMVFPISLIAALMLPPPLLRLGKKKKIPCFLCVFLRNAR